MKIAGGYSGLDSGFSLDGVEQPPCHTVSQGKEQKDMDCRVWRLIQTFCRAPSEMQWC